MNEWKVSGSSKRCLACGREFPPGEPFFSALREKGADLERCDFCTGCWPGNEGFYSHWRTTIKPPDQTGRRPVVIDYEALRETFRTILGDETRRGLAYVLALMLLRKRLFKLVETRRVGTGTVLVLGDRVTDEHYQVEEIDLSEEAVENLQRELNRLLDIEEGSEEQGDEESTPQAPETEQGESAEQPPDDSKDQTRGGNSSNPLK